MGEDGFVLPSGTVSLLLSDIQGFTRSREWDPEGTNRALAEVNATLDDLIGRFDGVQPLEQGEGDSCVTTFERVPRCCRLQSDPPAGSDSGSLEVACWCPYGGRAASRRP
jgi:class 3 adenylate cyclase